MSRELFEFHGGDQFNIGIDPDKVRELHDETLPKGSAEVVHFCSTKITQEMREYAAAQGISEIVALKQGMEVKAIEFVKNGAKIYSKH